MRLPFTSLAAALAISLLLGNIAAADDPMPKFALQNVQAIVYENLSPWKLPATYGVGEILVHDGKTLVQFSADILPEWTEEISQLSIDGENIKLAAGGGEGIPMTGYFDRYAQFMLEARSIYIYRPSEWQENKEIAHFNAVFAVPEGTKTAELQLGPVATKIDIPGTPQPEPDPLKTIKLEITSARFVESVPAEKGLGDFTAVTRITNPFGKILEVKVNIHPQMGNGDDPDSFFWYTPWIALKTGQGQWCQSFGEEFMGGLSQGVSHNRGRDSEGFGFDEATFYFAVPAGVTTYQLYYLGRPAAEGRV